jgi:hypothetical protein
MPKTTFERWFDKLVKNKMGGAALSVAGIAVGLLIIEAGRAIQPPFDWYVALAGLVLIWANVGLFIIAGAVYIVLWAKHTLTD